MILHVDNILLWVAVSDQFISAFLLTDFCLILDWTVKWINLNRCRHVVAGLPGHPVRFSIITRLKCRLVVIIGSDHIIISVDSGRSWLYSRIGALVEAVSGLLALIGLAPGPEGAGGLGIERPEADEDAEQEQPPWHSVWSGHWPRWHWGWSEWSHEDKGWRRCTDGAQSRLKLLSVERGCNSNNNKKLFIRNIPKIINIL